jgi:lactoylglutathione lyase
MRLRTASIRRNLRWLGRRQKRANCERNGMKIEHVAMYVNDLKAARDFFVKYLGGKSNDGYHNVNTDFRSFFISFDDGARIELMNKPGLVDSEKQLTRTGYIHIALSVGSKEKVDELTDRLKNDGFEVVSGPRTTGDGYYESCIVAIEGNQIEITV